MELISSGLFNLHGLGMPSGSCISAYVLAPVQDARMCCIKPSWLRFVLMLNQTFWLGLNSKICSRLRSSIWSGGVATVPGAVLGERTRLCMEGPQGLRQWLAGCF